MSFSNPTSFALGQTAYFDGLPWTLKARMVLGVEEEGETYYWNEYILTASGGRVLYLELDEGTWRLMRPFSPNNPPSMKALEAARAGQRVSIQGTAARVTKVDTATVHHIDGLPPFETRVGQRYRYFDAEEGPLLFAADWTEGGEVDFFRGRPLSERAVREAFGLKESPVAPRGPAGFGTVALTTLILAVASFIGSGWAGCTGETAHAGKVPFAEFQNGTARLGPYTLDPSKGPHRLALSMSGADAQVWVCGVLEKENGTELVSAQGVLYSLRGRDEDGPWQENVLSTYDDFVVRKPGPYYVRLHAKKDSAGGTVKDVGVEIRRGVMHGGYFRSLGWWMVAATVVAFILACWAGKRS